MTEWAGDEPDDGTRTGADSSVGDEPDTGAQTDADPPTCAEAGCERVAAVVLHVPWDEDRAVCPAHARVLARPDGVVAEPIEGTEAEWP